jgi:transposase-like protein
MQKFTIKDFNAKYPDDAACLEKFYQERYGLAKSCPQCKKPFKFYKITNRKCWQCQYCAHQIHPLAGTIFHKSETSLKSWFFAIFLFSQSKNGVSGKELQRQLGVTYKTAWRMAKQIRKLLASSGPKLSKTVEVDETYVGGVRRGKRGRGAEGKTAVFGLVQREGELHAEVVPNTRRETILPLITENVEKGSRIMSDEYSPYNKVRSMGYYHRRIKHGINQYVRGLTHVNTIEGFWSQLKRSINGTYHAVSPAYLQSYVDEFSWRYNQRVSPEHPFSLMVELAARPD